MSATVDDNARAAILAKRDLVVDLTRVTCVLLVVVIHLLMIGVGLGADGAIVTSRPLEEQRWFAWATWAGQIMPLFFVVGGFASLTAWRSLQRKGGDAHDFRRGRLLRLAWPALPLFVFFAIALGVATALGVDPALLDTVATGVGSPLWFLAAYLLCQAFVPLMDRLHREKPARTLAVLAAGAVIVDAARITSGITEIGLYNLFFVWLFVQQLGFWYADGWFRARSRLLLVAFVVAAYATMAVLVAPKLYPIDMLGNLNPPTVPLMLLGIAQISLLTLLHPLLARLMRARWMQNAVFVLGSRAMTIYLWHLPVIIAIAGLALPIPGAAPLPASGPWWMSRVLIFLVVLALVLALSIPLARFETPRTTIPDAASRPSPARIWCAAVLAFVPPFAVMQWHLDLPIALGGAVLLAASLLLLRPVRMP